MLSCHVPYVGKFWSGKILANLANGKPFAKVFPANIFNTPNRIPEQNCNILKYFKPKQRHEDNDDEVKPKGLPDPNGDLSKVVPSSSIEVTEYSEVTNAVVR